MELLQKETVTPNIYFFPQQKKEGSVTFLKVDDTNSSTFDEFSSVPLCRNLSFGLTTKAKGLQECGPRKSPGVTSHTLGNVGKCEGVNPHTPKATPTLGDGVPWTPKISKSDFRSQNSMACCVLYIIGNLLERKFFKWARIAHLDI
jgi:hypothetical protein